MRVAGNAAFRRDPETRKDFDPPPRGKPAKKGEPTPPTDTPAKP